MRRTLASAAVAVLALVLGAEAHAQQSSSYKVQEHVLNAGGDPQGASFAFSASFRITLDALGEGIVGAGPSSASFRADGGFTSGYIPPSEVVGLAFLGKTALTWTPEKSVGTYQLYRGLVGGLPGTYGSCLMGAISGTPVIDAASPASGASFFYLVTARNRLGEEGTKGRRSSGAQRPNPTPCP